MVVEHTRALISYNNNRNAQDQGHFVANNLKNSLRREGIDARAEGYSDSALDANLQWLILIHSSEIEPSSRITGVVKSALEQVVERRMRGVLAVTTTTRSDLRPEWASIRKYDATNLTEEQLANGVLSAMQYAKAPYTQELARQRGQRVGTSRGQQISLRLLIAVVLLTIIVVSSAATLVIYGVKIRTDGLNASASATALLQSHRSQTATAIASQVSPIVDPTQQAQQKTLKDLTKPTPTIQGFRDTDQWSAGPGIDTMSCSSGARNATYTVVMKTTGDYYPCMAKNPPLTNFALQVTMRITGDAGGVIFRADGDGGTPGTYYRLSVNQGDQATSGNDTVSMYLCHTDCMKNGTYDIGSGTPLGSANTENVDPTKPITLAILVQDKNVDVYINGTYLVRFTAPASSTPLKGGQIGLYAASVKTSTTVTFSGLKVWGIENQPTNQPKPTPPGQLTPTPTP
ncbi:MAG TPA: family 16 glycoside hydrolase [Ktedonobacteraceae bacterium]|nr:family 16 glycoside hydrolase [Ktedonobacteraceae bacterium]